MYPNLFDANLSHPFFSEPILKTNVNMLAPMNPGYMNTPRFNNGLASDSFNRQNMQKPKSGIKSVLIAAAVALCSVLGYKGGSKLSKILFK